MIHHVCPEQFHKKPGYIFKKSQISDKHGKIEKQKIKVFGFIFATMSVGIVYFKCPDHIFKITIIIYFFKKYKEKARDEDKHISYIKSFFKYKM